VSVPIPMFSRPEGAKGEGEAQSKAASDDLDKQALVADQRRRWAEAEWSDRWRRWAWESLYTLRHAIGLGVIAGVIWYRCHQGK